MKAYHWDELLEDEDLMELTEEAMSPRTARRIPWRRLGALAACLALILFLTNYQALATGVQTLIRYFSGVGAAETGADLRIQEGELEFELSGRTYLISGAYARDGILFVPLEVVSRSEERLNGSNYQNLYVKMEVSQKGQALAGSNPFLSLSDNGSYSTGQYTALTRKRISFSPLQEDQYLGWRYLREGYQTYAQAVFTYEAANPDGSYTLQVEDYLTNQVREVELTLAPPEEIAAICEQRTVDEVQVTALVSADGRRLSLYGPYTARWPRLRSGGSLWWNCRPSTSMGSSSRRRTAPAIRVSPAVRAAWMGQDIPRRSCSHRIQALSPPCTSSASITPMTIWTRGW